MKLKDLIPSMNEAEKAGCYVCEHTSSDVQGGGRYSCKKQQLDDDGKCPGGYSSHNKCNRKCNRISGDDVGISPTRRGVKEQVNPLILKKVNAFVNEEKTEVSIRYKPGTDPINDVTISWGEESHTVDFDAEDVIDDHGNEGKDMSFVAFSEDDKWRFIVDVSVEASYDMSGNIQEVMWDTLEIDVDDLKKESKMKKSQLRQIIKKSIKELLTEKEKQYCWWCSGEKVGAGACKRGLSQVPADQCMKRGECLKKCAGHKDNDYKTTPKKYLYSTHVKPTKDKKQINETKDRFSGLNPVTGKPTNDLDIRRAIKDSIKKLLEKNIADPCVCTKNSDCKGGKEVGCRGETCFNGRCETVDKNNYKMKQQLNEAINCINPPAGASCGGGKIWCEVEQSSGYGQGCFCRNPKWCDQNGTNPTCSDGKTAVDGSCAGGGGKPGIGNALEPTRRRGMNEAEEASCYKCMYSGRSFACQKQQLDANGKCNDGYKSLKKCQRKCNSIKGDRMVGISPTRDR